MGDDPKLPEAVKAAHARVADSDAARTDEAENPTGLDDGPGGVFFGSHGHMIDEPASHHNSIYTESSGEVGPHNRKAHEAELAKKAKKAE